MTPRSPCPYRKTGAIDNVLPFHIVLRCRRYETQTVESELLLKSLLEEGPSSLANRILFKAGVGVSKVEEELEKYVSSQPRVSGDATDKVGRPTRTGRAVDFHVGKGL